MNDLDHSLWTLLPYLNLLRVIQGIIIQIYFGIHPGCFTSSPFYLSKHWWIYWWILLHLTYRFCPQLLSSQLRASVRLTESPEIRDPLFPFPHHFPAKATVVDIVLCLSVSKPTVAGAQSVNAPVGGRCSTAGSTFGPPSGCQPASARSSNIWLEEQQFLFPNLLPSSPT